jgi:two-component system sensor histidine kinase HydH
VRSSRATYFPTASIVVGMVILAVVVGAVSFRDIDRGRRHVAEVLHREAVATVRFMAAAFRADLLAPNWHRRRLDLFFENAGSREQVAYMAVLGPGDKVLAHSDPERLGETWPSALKVEIDPRTGYTRGEFVSVDGRRVFQVAAILDVSASGVISPMPRRIGRRPPRGIIPDMTTIVERLSDLLQRPVDPGETILLTAVVGLDSSDLEAAFLASRNHTIMMSGVLLVAGGVAIYFLFVLAGYRSAQTALANMRSYTTNVIESMASGLVSVDADGRVVTVNSRARKLLALGGESVKGRPLSDVLVIDPVAGSVDMDSVVRGERDMLEAETAIVVEGSSLPVVLSASSLVDDYGKRSGAVALFQDQREVEALKAEVERARHLAALGRLAAGVAHEVRNPLSSLKGFAQFLRSRFQPGSDEERYSDIMIEEVERLDRVVQELLDFARPVSPTREPVSANAVVREALSLVSEDAGFRNVRVVQKLGNDLPHALADPLQVKQVLLNLFLNAIEAMGQGGTLTVATGAERCDDGRPYVTIAVTDTGVGLDADELVKLFEPFYTTKQKGTGLGLTIVSRLVEQNGGHIDVTSATGEGTTFSLRLPTVPGGGASRESAGGPSTGEGEPESGSDGAGSASLEEEA